jgi:hypothetical protein
LKRIRTLRRLRSLILAFLNILQKIKSSTIHIQIRIIGLQRPIIKMNIMKNAIYGHVVSSFVKFSLEKIPFTMIVF